MISNIILSSKNVFVWWWLLWHRHLRNWQLLILMISNSILSCENIFVWCWLKYRFIFWIIWRINYKRIWNLLLRKSLLIDSSFHIFEIPRNNSRFLYFGIIFNWYLQTTDPLLVKNHGSSFNYGVLLTSKQNWFL